MISLKVVLFGLLLLSATFVTIVLYLGTYDGLSVEKLEETIRAWGAWGVIASIGLMVLHSFVPFPAELLAIANGMVYGPIWGTVITWVGAMLGAFLAFALSRTLGRSFVELLIAKNNWHVLDEWTEIRGGRLILISRFIPVIAFNLVNYAAGLTRVSYWTFAWATGIGILPMTILMVVMGDYIETVTTELWILVGVAVIILWVVLRGRLRYRAAEQDDTDIGLTDELTIEGQ